MKSLKLFSLTGKLVRMSSELNAGTSSTISAGGSSHQSVVASAKPMGRLILDALKGVPGDYTEGPIGKAVILLGIPMIVEGAMESIASVTDIFFVGRLGRDAIAAIGLTESILSLVHIIAYGLGIGATAIVSRRIGERDIDGAAVTAVQVLILGVIVSALTAVVGVKFAPQLLRFMGGSPALVAYAVPYMRIMFGGTVAMVILVVASAIFRGAGDGAIAMRAMAISNGLNLILVPCLVKGLLFFPQLGLNGAAAATITAQGVGALYTLRHLFGGPGRLKTQARHWKLGREVMARVFGISALGTFQIFLTSASWFALIRVVSTFGSDAVAGYTIGLRIILFALFPAFGLSFAASTMAGQMLGAGKPDRAEKAVWLTGLYNLGFLGSMGVFFMIFAPIIVGWFTTESIVHSYAVAFLRTIAPGFPLYAFGMVLNESFNGAGDPWTPTCINFFVFWVFEIPAAWLLSHILRMGPQGVFLAVTLALSAFTIVSAVIFRRGHWKTQHV